MINGAETHYFESLCFILHLSTYTDNLCFTKIFLLGYNYLNLLSY